MKAVTCCQMRYTVPQWTSKIRSLLLRPEATIRISGNILLRNWHSIANLPLIACLSCFYSLKSKASSASVDWSSATSPSASTPQGPPAEQWAGRISNPEGPSQAQTPSPRLTAPGIDSHSPQSPLHMSTEPGRAPETFWAINGMCMKRHTRPQNHHTKQSLISHNVQEMKRVRVA